MQVYTWYLTLKNLMLVDTELDPSPANDNWGLPGNLEKKKKNVLGSAKRWQRTKSCSSKHVLPPDSSCNPTSVDTIKLSLRNKKRWPRLHYTVNWTGSTAAFIFNSAAVSVSADVSADVCCMFKYFFWHKKIVFFLNKNFLFLFM